MTKEVSKCCRAPIGERGDSQLSYDLYCKKCSISLGRNDIIEVEVAPPTNDWEDEFDERFGGDDGIYLPITSLKKFIRTLLKSKAVEIEEALIVDKYGKGSDDRLIQFSEAIQIIKSKLL